MPRRTVPPDPDALIALAAREGRGRLKVFLGAAPGVGKTFEMLAEARRLHAGGSDVLAGIIETHGRADTIAQIGTLPILPRARLDYRGQVLEEFDLDAALALRPKVLLLDELAHSNAPGSRHPKRWQDVEELRDAGIEVWTTMNVQHLESLNDRVARVTGVRVAETVPDQVLAGADAVELIDIPPADLLERLRQGKVYRPDQARRALQGFFREGNLAALREMALRRTAERVDADVTTYMRAHAIAGPWPTHDRVLALIGADGTAETVVRQAGRIAEALRAPLLALHVERPGTVDTVDPAPALRLAESLGASVETVVATDLPAAILAHAQARNATHLVVGRGRPVAWRRLLGRTLSSVLVRRGTDFALHLVPDPTVPRKPVLARPPLPPWTGWAVAVAMPLLATTIGVVTDGNVPEGALGMVYLAATVAAAVGFGPLPGLVAAMLSFLLWNFLFLPPRYTFAIGSAQDVVGAAVFSLVALLLAGTTGRLGSSARAAQARLLGLRRLVEFSRRLGAPGTEADLVIAVAEEAQRIALRPTAVLMPLPPAPGDTTPEPVLRAAVPAEAEPDATAMAAASWAMAHGVATGHGTATLPAGTPWQFRPMRTARGVVGLLGLRLDDADHALATETDQALAALADQAAVAIERTRLMEEQARGAARAETEQLRTALLTSLGHDLRTPLTSIQGALGTLRANSALPDATRQDLLAMAEEEVVRLNRSIANILDIVRIENGQVAPRREAVDIADAIEAAVARAERTTARGVARDVAPGLPTPRLDPVLLDQILANLLENALKFSGGTGQVSVMARRDGHDVAIAVEDDGPGIAPEHLGRIFDPFYRAGRSDQVVAGTGLGLAISRGLAAAMGGRIAAESPVRHGHGTRMTLRVPA